MKFLLVFGVGCLSQFLIGFNIRNVSQGRISAASITSFLIAVTWGTAVMLIAADLKNWLNLLFFGLGASAGVSFSILLDRYIYQKDKPD